MEEYSVYNDISKRTNGEFYLGVCGPVRTGKSTFIKKFMEMFVLPGIRVKMTESVQWMTSSVGRGKDYNDY